MSSFKEFIDKANSSPDKILPSSSTSLTNIQTSLALSVGNLLKPFPTSNDKKQQFSEKVSNCLQDEVFISELSDQIGNPSEKETEDDFVERGKHTLRNLLYKKFGIKR